MSEIITDNQKYIKPLSIKEALAFAEANKNNCKYIAGGTDVLVNKFQGNDTPKTLIDLSKIKELKGIEIEGDFLRIGALTTLFDLSKSELIKQYFPTLIEAANTVGSPVIRKSATLGGNLLVENRCSYFNQTEWWREAVGYCLKCDLPEGKSGGDICIATGGKNRCFSKFVSDTVPVLICLGAIISVKNKEKEYQINVENIYTGDGITPRIIKNNEIIEKILIPLNLKTKVAFRKLRLRQSLDFTSLSAAAAFNNKNEIIISLSGIDPQPIVTKGEKNDNINELIGLAVKKSRIVDNDIFPRDYRKEMIAVYLNQCFKELNLI